MRASARLRALVKEAAPNAPWAVYWEDHLSADEMFRYWWVEDKDGILQSLDPSDLNQHRAILIALAPQLAELCADMGEALAIGDRQEWHPYERNLADSALARLDALFSEEQA